jgi:hypothetical protein
MIRGPSIFWPNHYAIADVQSRMTVASDVLVEPVGCSQLYCGVRPQYIGRVLCPTGRYGCYCWELRGDVRDCVVAGSTDTLPVLVLCGW